MKPFTVRSYFLLLCLIPITSCDKEEATRVSPDEGIVLNLSYQCKETASRLSQEDQQSNTQATTETRVHNITLLLYNEKGELLTATYTDRPHEPVTLNIRDKTTASLYAVANVGDWTQKIHITTLNGLKKTFWPYQPDSLAQNGTLPMSGKKEAYYFQNGNKLTLSLERLVAKFRLLVDTTQLSNEVECFDIKQIRLRNLNRRVQFFTESKAEMRSWIVDSSLAITGNELNAIWNSGLDFYLPENCQGDLLSGNTDPSTHIPPAPYDSLCTYVEFLVNYKTQTHWDPNLVYRYYLHNGKLLDNFDVRRNTMYTCQTLFCGDGLNETTWRIDASGMQDRVTQIQLTPSASKLTRRGETLNLEAKVLPQSAANPTLQWMSSNDAVATVSQNGVVTAQNDGECTITVLSLDNTQVTASASIEVDTYIPVTTVHIAPKSGNCQIGETFAFSATLFPEDATNPLIRWKSTNVKIASVNTEGVVTGNNYGKCQIIASSYNGKISDTADFEVSAKTFTLHEIPTLYPGYNTPWPIQHSGRPEGSPTYTLTDKTGMASSLYLSNNTLYFKIPSLWTNESDSDIIATGLLTGTLNEIERSQEIHVSSGQISFQASYQLCQGVPEYIAPETLIPGDIPITWISSDTQILRFDQNGNAIPLQPGTVTVTASIASGAKTSFEVQVLEPTLRILGGNTQTIYERQGLQLESLSSPHNSSALTIRWKIVNGNQHAVISPSGTLTGIQRTNNQQVVVRAYYETLPDIYDEASFSVLPIVSARLTDSLLLNTTILEPQRPVPDIPTATQLLFDHSPSTTIHWKVFREDGTQVEDLNINEKGDVLLAKMAASGRYLIRGYDASEQYSTDPLLLKIYQYLEYEVGLESYKSEVIYDSSDPDEGTIKYTYDMNSRWEFYSWNWLSKARLNNTVLARYFDTRELLTYPIHNLPRHTICSAQTNNLPHQFTNQCVESIPYNPQFTVWDDLTASSYLWNADTQQQAPGIRGLPFEFNAYEHYFIRQKDNLFYNGTYD